MIPSGDKSDCPIAVKRAGVVERLSTTARQLLANPLIPNQRGLDRFSSFKTLVNLFQIDAAPLLAVAISLSALVVADYQDQLDRHQTFGIITLIQ